MYILMKYKSDFKKYCKYEDGIYKNILFVCLLFNGLMVYLEQGLGVFRVEHPLPTITRKEFKIQENIVSISRKPLPVL